MAIHASTATSTIVLLSYKQILASTRTTIVFLSSKHLLALLPRRAIQRLKKVCTNNFGHSKYKLEWLD
jgi:hypothetical protein